MLMGYTSYFLYVAAVPTLNRPATSVTQDMDTPSEPCSSQARTVRVARRKRSADRAGCVPLYFLPAVQSV